MSKELKKRIVELEEKNRYIADSLLDAIWIVDADTLKYEFITPSIEKMSGYTDEETMNLSVTDGLTPESLQRIKTILAEERKRFEQGLKTVRTLELEFVHKDGSLYWTEIKAKFVKEADGSLKIVGVSREITERKAAQKRQNDLMFQLGETLAEKERLLKEVKVLRGLLPICSGCKRIRDDKNRWWPLDAYIQEHTEADLTHTLCPDCNEVFYSDP
jgi:PAS domain S-box-containing protein